MKKPIELTIAGKDFKFVVSPQDHNDFIDSTARGGSITAASHNLLMRTVVAEQKEDMKTFLLNNPGAELQIGAYIKAEYSPVLEITVKK